MLRYRATSSHLVAGARGARSIAFGGILLRREVTEAHRSREQTTAYESLGFDEVRDTNMVKEGDQVGAYVLRRRLGAGGMGEVYLAQHRYMERRAAIKFLLPDFSRREDLVERFLTEARATSRISHSGIVEILDCDRNSAGIAYIVMEFLEGENLGTTLERVPAFGSRSILGIVGQIASALAAAHAKGIVHRDLKPDNIFLALPRGEPSSILVKVLDFGIAKLIEQGSNTRRTTTGSLVGTPIYMSPEQCRGRGTVDHRTDVYSLGCMAFELCTGRPPFLREGAGELIAAHLSEMPPDTRTIEPNITDEMANLIAAMLEKSPNARPQSMGEIVRFIEGMAGVREPDFRGLVEPPAGFPRPLADDDLPSPRSHRLPPVEHPGMVPMRPAKGSAGGTRLLPQNVTTFDAAASELTVPPLRRSKRGAWFAMLVMVGIAAGVFAAYRGSVSAPSTPSPVPSATHEADRPPPSALRAAQTPAVEPPMDPARDRAAEAGLRKVSGVPPHKPRRVEKPVRAARSDDKNFSYPVVGD